MLADTTLELSFYAKSLNGSNIKLGNTNIAVRLNENNLNISNAYLPTTYNSEFEDASFYRKVSLGNRENLIVISVLKLSSFHNSLMGGKKIENQPMLVAKINIPVKRACTTSGITWEIQPVAVTDFDNTNIKSQIEYKKLDPDFKLEGIPAKFQINSLALTTICEGQNIQLNSNSKSNLTWYKDGVVLQSSSTVLVSESGVYSASANSCSTPILSDNQIGITVNPLPITPVISQAGRDLISTSNSSIQWFKDGNLLDGEISQIYKPLYNGLYTVVSKNDCGTKTSNTINFNINSVTKKIDQFALSVYPNPIERFSTISYSLPKSANIIVEIWNLFGQKISELSDERKQSGKHSLVLDIEKYNMSSAIYLLKFYADNEVTTTSLVVNK